MWSKSVLLILSLLMFGCTSMAEKAPLIRNESFIHFKVVDRLTPSQPVNVVGITSCSPEGICDVQVLEKYLVECAGHEVLHTIKDNWHEGFEMNCKTGRVK